MLREERKALAEKEDSNTAEALSIFTNLEEYVRMRAVFARLTLTSSVRNLQCREATGAAGARSRGSGAQGGAPREAAQRLPRAAPRDRG